jgi:hypothetical protein
MTDAKARRQGRRIKKTEEQVQEVVVAVEEAPARAPMRAEMHEDPRDRAARRSTELRNHLKNLDQGEDSFYVDPNTIPDGWSYEWKRKFVYGAEDPSYTIQVMQAGWEPVPTSRHPELMPVGSTSPIIERKGMVLMERPAEITAEARQLDLNNARNRLRRKEDQLRHQQGNAFMDHSNPNARPVINKSYEPIRVPDNKM